MTDPTQITEQPKSHILIVDDEPGIRQMLALCFKKKGFRITSAGDAAEASKLLVQEQFDAIVSDIMMPGEDGISFLGRVHESWPEIPVILMTGHVQMQMAVNAIKNGAFDFVCKPFDVDYMGKIVERAVNYSKLQRMEKNYRVELENMVSLRTAELKTSMAELDFARKALQQAATDKSNFMSTVSHEMRTPMNGVIGSLELMAEEGVSGVSAEYLAMARQSADNMMTLINQLLSFNAPQANGGEVSNRDLIDLPSLLNAIITNNRPLFTLKGLALSVRMADDLPQQICTDREKISRLIEILFNNALKFTTHGAVSLEASRLCSDGGGESLVFVVTDSGTGIPEGMLERIFEPFVQGDGSLSRCYEGVGLGLAIARQNASLLNGCVYAEHVPAGGSRFIVTIKISTP